MKEKEVTSLTEYNGSFNEQEFLKRVEKAAGKGARSAGFVNSFISIIPVLIILGLIAFIVVEKINTIGNAFTNSFSVDKPVENHDLTLNDAGVFGHTVADFEEAILGDSEKMKKIEVFKQKISESSTLTNTGLFNLGMFTKTQVITFSGSVIYTVDLSKLTKSDIEFNEEEKIITIKIPHAEQGEITVNRNDIIFNDPDRGLLALGKMNTTPEEVNKIEIEAQNKMQEKLDSDNILENADRFAKLSVWEMYSPIIQGVAKDFSLEVVFK